MIKRNAAHTVLPSNFFGRGNMYTIRATTASAIPECKIASSGSRNLSFDIDFLNVLRWAFASIIAAFWVPASRPIIDVWRKLHTPFLHLSWGQSKSIFKLAITNSGHNSAASSFKLTKASNFDASTFRFAGTHSATNFAKSAIYCPSFPPPNFWTNAHAIGMSSGCFTWLSPTISAMTSKSGTWPSLCVCAAMPRSTILRSGPARRLAARVAPSWARRFRTYLRRENR